VRSIDIAKAAGIAAVVLTIDVLVAIAVVFAWGAVFAPGHSGAFYETAGVPIARWSTRIAGTALVFGAAWLFCRRRSEPNAILFAVTLIFFYAVFDGASVAFKGFFSFDVAVTMLLKLAGAVAGALVGVRARPGAASTPSMV
jgi:hypothetical protein